MKELVRKILKEEVNRSNLQKGIDIMTQFAKTEFPFIEYGKLRPEDDDFFRVNIDLYCNLEKTIEFYNSEMKPWWSENYKEKEEGFAYSFSLLTISDELSVDEKYKIYTEINDSLNFHYGSLPEEYVSHNQWGEVKELYVEKFFFI